MAALTDVHGDASRMPRNNAQEEGRNAEGIKTIIKRLKNPLIPLNVGVQGKLLFSDADGFKYVREALSNHREGFFKLECSENLTLEKVFLTYSRRDTVEKLMYSLKNHIDLKPACIIRELCEMDAFPMFLARRSYL